MSCAKLYPWSCGSPAHLSRRTLLKAAGMSGLTWMTSTAEALARQDSADRGGRPAQSVILLWLSGGPSQLETFDPHPGTKIAGDTGAISTSAEGVQLASGLQQLAAQMDAISLIRNVVTNEGDHERAAYNVKTGYRPDPTLRHPSLGAIICHQLPAGQTEIPRHISILPDDWYGKGGYLGQQFDAFRMFETAGEMPDLKPHVAEERFEERLQDLDVVDKAFHRGRLRALESDRTGHRTTVERAVRMMSSEQLQALQISQETRAVQNDFGDADFGRGCLAALRLIEVGVRCVEVTLGGWDSHIDNHDIHARLVKQLDPAFSALLRHLRLRDRLTDTLVLCTGEFGRTPAINPAGGRDHWPHGFSVAVAGGNLRGGEVVGTTDPQGQPVPAHQGTKIADVHATLLKALGIPPARELDTPVGRPMRLSEGRPLDNLLMSSGSYLRQKAW